MGIEQLIASPTALYYASAHQSAVSPAIAASTWTVVNFDTVDSDPNGNFTKAAAGVGGGTTTSACFYTCPVTGRYLVTASLALSNSAGIFILAIYKNGVEVKRGVYNNSASVTMVGDTVTGIVQATAGDTIDIRVFENGVSLTTAGAATTFDINLLTGPMAPVAPQVVTSATRPANPFLGQQIFETDTSNFLIWAGTSWKQPWGQPWGFLIRGIKTANQTGVATTVTDVSSLSVTLTAVVNRWYKVTVVLPQVVQNTSTGTITVVVTNGAGGTTFGTGVATWAAGTGSPLTFSYLESPGAGSITRKVRISTTAGTVDVDASATQPAYIIIEDIGPNGNPA